MEKFISKTMNETQVNEIVELMNGDHAEALELWRAENQSAGEGTGLIAGALFGILGTAAVWATVNLAKQTWNFGKSFVELVKERLPATDN